MTFVAPGHGFCGEIEFGGDKSLSHRLVLFSLLNSGTFGLENLSACDDVATSLEIFRRAGGHEKSLADGKIELSGPARLNDAEAEFFCGNSGTSARLLCGILAGQPYEFRLSGDESLQKRPMARIIKPLSEMGATFSDPAQCLPLTIKGCRNLRPIAFSSPVASAQVKSAILFAAAQTEGLTVISEPFPSRDHTERLLAFLGADIRHDAGKILFNGPFRCRQQREFKIPGDISSAAFVIVAALLLPGSSIICRNVLLNPGRISFLHKLRQMGAKIDWQIKSNDFEPAGDIEVEYTAELRKIAIQPDEIAGLIDELPALAAAMAVAEGVSSVTGAGELRVKESDRIDQICRCLREIGIDAREKEDGYEITGQTKINGDREKLINTGEDHRIAATMLVLALASQKGMAIDNLDCIKISFPEYGKAFAGFGF